MFRTIMHLTVALLLVFALNDPRAAQAETFSVGYIPYDGMSYTCIVNQELGLWKKYMPKGTELQFEGFITGPTLFNTLLAGKNHIGYVGAMPAVIACSKPDMASIKMVGTSLVCEGTNSSIMLVRTDAPEFKSYEELARWLDGKVIAAPRGSGTDLFMRKFFAKYNVKPKDYLNQNIEAIATNFRSGKLDAAGCWEPTVSRIATDVGEGIARIVAAGQSIPVPDVGTIIMRADFLEKHPDIAKAYLKSELEAQRYILDPANQKSVTEMLSKHAKGISLRVLWYTLYGKVPANHPDPVRRWQDFYITDSVRDYMVNNVTPFLHEEKVINIATLPEGTIDDSIAREVFKESGLDKPFSDKAVLGVIEGRPASESPFDN